MKSWISRRGFLLGGLGAGIAAIDACAAPSTNAAGTGVQAARPTVLPPSSATAPKETVVTEQVHSTARGATVELVSIRPAGVPGRLPVCLALHGRSSGARMFLELGVPEQLTVAVSGGVPPFAVVAVDGGDSYWVARTPADDPQRMLLEDLPQWLANRGFANTPNAVLGISMGGYGALHYARNAGVAAAAAISPALFSSWTDARLRNAFAGEEQWAATEPLRHLEEIEDVQLGVWCGASDPFINQARELVTKGRPAVAALGPGGHDGSYWRRVLPDVLRFVGETMA